MQKTIALSYEVVEMQALSAEEAALKNAAESAIEKAYAPYSNFKVGCSVLLENGEIVHAANQEVAAYPVCICAEGSALSMASGLFPTIAVKAIFVTAKNTKGMAYGAAPCGVCRQRIVEYEQRFGQSIKIYFPENENHLVKFNQAKDLLPFSFTGANL